MPDIRLRDYTSKIKDLEANGRQDEAIAHGQQILHLYPMHVVTYALLGEAFLKKGLLPEATELFQRALSGDPESLTSRIGLAKVFEQEGRLPEAIWQMERAFALEPGNPGVRRELGRMYAERDGIPEARLKLTRDALGRLYARNGLYERAITEFRAVLRLDPDLPDMQVALAESLWREGRRLEAVETCLSLLEQVPNCLKANLILGHIWLKAGHDELAKEKLDIANALDPENLVAQEMMGGDSPLPPGEVFVPELEITEEELNRLVAKLEAAAWVEAEEPAVDEAPPEPEPLTDLDLPWAEAKELQEEMPEWLREPLPPAEAVGPAISAERYQLEQQLGAEPGDNRARLELARLCRAGQDLEASLGHYEKLISDPELRSQVIDDLGALAEEDVDRSQVFQLIGDAHAQDGQMAQALEMYRQALDASRGA